MNMLEAKCFSRKKSDLILYGLGILVLFFLLIPRYWEPCSGGESVKQWVAARILAETKGMPNLSLGPLYVTYLQIYQSLQYPLSIQLEFFITHFLVHIAIFFMLRKIIPDIFAFILTCAWIPELSMLEPGGMVAGIGFLSLYLTGSKIKSNQDLFPLSLVAASLCHSSYMPFLIAHVLSSLFIRLRNKEKLINLNILKDSILLNVLRILIAVVILLTVFFQSPRSDNNHMLANPSYCPVNLKSPLTVAFFVIGSAKYARRETPESTWVDQDWFNLNEEAYGGAKTILGAFIKKRDTVIKNILEEVGAISVYPRLFFSGNLRGILPLFSILLFPFGLIGMIFRYTKEKMFIPLFAIIFGTLAVIFVLLLTWFAKRYMLALLPVGLLIVAYSGYGMSLFVIGFKERKSLNKFIKPMHYDRTKFLGLLFSPIIFIIFALLINPVTMAKFYGSALSPDRTSQLVGLDILFLLMSVVFLGFNYLSEGVSPRKIGKMGSKLSGGIVLVSAVIVLLTSSFPKGISSQFKAVMKNESFLKGFMGSHYRRLFQTINKNSRILAIEGLWLKAFSETEIDNIYQSGNFPPFKDPTNRTEEILNSLDTIWVKKQWTEKKPSVATQAHLRYRVHVQPFLDKALSNGWSKEEVVGYGVVYQKSHLINNQEKK